MATLTIWERFKDAREVHNQHGKQTLEEVAKATGLAASLINSLEKENNERDVGYKKIITLAKHYGVSIDWLLGESEAISTNSDIRSIADYLNLNDLFVIELENILHEIPKEKIDAIFDMGLLDVIRHLYACFDIMMVNKLEFILTDKCYGKLWIADEEWRKRGMDPNDEEKIARIEHISSKEYDTKYEHIAESGILGPEASRMMHVQKEMAKAWLDDFNESGGFQVPMMTVSGMKLAPLIYANAENQFQRLIDEIGDSADEYAEKLLSKMEM